LVLRPSVPWPATAQEDVQPQGVAVPAADEWVPVEINVEGHGQAVLSLLLAFSALEHQEFSVAPVRLDW